MKRNGVNVIVLEQDPSNDRRNHESGVAIGPSVTALLEKYDATGRPAAIPTGFISFAWRKRLRIFNKVWPHHMSNWGCLYLILRANFDGMKSEAVPNPPGPKDGDGKAEYWPGKRVTGLDYDRERGIVTTHFIDVSTGESGSLSAEMVIGADGVRSTVRKILQTPTKVDYAGYSAWRGTVPESQVSEATVDYFSNRVYISITKGSYFVK